MGHRLAEIVVWEAVWNGTVVAEAAHLTRLGGRRFFPVGPVRWDPLREAGSRPGPSGLGRETTFDVVVDHLVAQHGARCYRDPAPEHVNIKNLITFSPDVVVGPVRRPAPRRTPRRGRVALSKLRRARPEPSVPGSD